MKLISKHPKPEHAFKNQNNSNDTKKVPSYNEDTEDFEPENL